MAEEALKKLEGQLICPICLDTYTDPKQLQCNHVFCQQCLVKTMFRNQQGQFILTCPNCRQVTSVPALGVAGLQAAFQTNQLLEIVKEHKNAKCTLRSSEKPDASTISTCSTIVCPDHDGREVELYCETCEKAICFRCIKKGEKHINHDYEELDEAFERYKGEITSSLEPMEKQLMIIERALEQLDVRCEDIANQQVTTEADIHHNFGRLHEALDARKTELISQLHQLTQAKLKSLALQRDQIETTQVQLSSCLLFMRENLKTDNQKEALMMKSFTIQQVKELTTKFQPEALKPDAIADSTFVISTNTSSEIKNCGAVYSSGPPDPSKCVIVGELDRSLVVGEKSTPILETFNSNNQPVTKESSASITCELVSSITGAQVKGSIDKGQQNQYKISYQPTIKGRHQLHIKVEGQHIRNSPFLIIATSESSIDTLGIPLLTIKDVTGPSRVAVNQKGEILVAERNRHCISMFSSNGERLRSFGTWGSGKGQFQNPSGLKVDKEGCILVTDYIDHRIQKFSADGRFITAAGSEGSGPLQFANPQGIALNPTKGKLYVGDSSCRIQILNFDLTYEDYFGEEGIGPGCLQNPHGLGFDSQGNVYVADYGNHCIQVFTAEGKWLRMFGRYGEGRGELKRPYGLSIDSNDRVYVSEIKNHRVSVFTSEGQFLTSFGRKGSDPGEFRIPAGLAVDSSGVVYVCDNGNNRVQLF